MSAVPAYRLSYDINTVVQLIGKGGFAREVASYLDTDHYQMFEYECEGINEKHPTLIAIGSGEVRKKMAERFNHLTYYWECFGKAYGNIEWSKGCIVCPGSVLSTNIKLGVHCVINMNCSIGHDTVMGDYVTISPGVNISGNVTIGDMVTIGSNAVIKEGVTICSGVIIGAGAVIVKDITEPGLYLGSIGRKNA